MFVNFDWVLFWNESFKQIRVCEWFYYVLYAQYCVKLLAFYLEMDEFNEEGVSSILFVFFFRKLKEILKKKLWENVN